MTRLREVFEHLRRLPGNRPAPAALIALEGALDSSYRLVRQTEPTVQEVLRRLEVLGDGIARLGLYAAELNATAIDAVRHADDIARYQLAQLVRLSLGDADDQPVSIHAEKDRRQRERDALVAVDECVVSAEALEQRGGLQPARVVVAGLGPRECALQQAEIADARQSPEPFEQDPVELERLIERREQRPLHFARRSSSSACSATTSSSAVRNAGRTRYLARYSPTASLTIFEMLRSVSAAQLVRDLRVELGGELDRLHLTSVHDSS